MEPSNLYELFIYLFHFVSGDTSDKQYVSKSYDFWNANNKVGAYLAVVKELQGETGRASQADQIFFTIGDNTKWEGYLNGPLQPTQTYRYALNYRAHAPTECRRYLKTTGIYAFGVI